MHKVLKLGGFLLATLVAHTATGDSVTPEEPGAYEPFLLEVDFPRKGNGGYAVSYVLDIDVDTHTIRVGYLNYGLTWLGPPYTTQTIEIQGLPPGTYSVSIAYMPDLAGGNPVFDDTGLTFDVADPPPTQHVHALFDESWERYFITASDSEADGLLVQNYWEIVDFGFTAWHADDPAPETAVPVCRFYSELVNSHFYTGSAGECTMLQEEDHGWEYEGIAFQALLPVDGACPMGTTPVWRLFNDRAAQFLSNHRFVASNETYRAMITEGWIGEGVAFCSPPESE